ncbi:MAG: NrfD/PsrC family molybdoenzyme membrane anchor subunit, partial [Planctomycetota bacterium]
EEAIIAGDLHDPNSRVAKLAAREEAQVRRPEQQTGPNVFYLGAEPITLDPGAAKEPSTYLWSERRLPPPEWPADRPVREDATTVLNVDHPVHWTWRVDAYLVTKGIAGGAAMLAWLPQVFGRNDGLSRWGPEAISLVFLTITMLLLIFDLKRPQYFFRLLTRPNWSSWLVKGGIILGAFGGCTAAILLARAAGMDSIANALRIPNAFLGLGTAIYTAWLFAQCEGRDLWQHKSKLAWHLTSQAVFLGAIALLPLALLGHQKDSLIGTMIMLANFGGFWHLAFALQEKEHKANGSRHDTSNAHQARLLLNKIPLFESKTLQNSGFGAFRTGITVSTIGLVLLDLAKVGGFLSVPLGALVVLTSVVGLFAYERAFVRAGQLPPLS